MRGQEATPIVIDGIMYTSGTWGYVYAVDAATGKELWRYDPKPDYFIGRHPCCDLVNRGVAVWKGKVYVASVDGRLHALNAATGKKIWEADTIADHKLPYSSTGAPQIAGHVVVIGNGGRTWGIRPFAATFPRTIWTRAPSSGVSIRCLPRWDSPMKIPSWRKPTRLGIPIADRNSKAAERHGTDSPTIRI